MHWLGVFCAILILVVIILLIKITLLTKSIDEICTELQSKLATETNTLISISSSNRHIRRLAKELNTQLRLLRLERQRFQVGDLKLNESVTNISHDLRTPLTAIRGYLELLKQEEKSPEVKRYLTIIENRSEILKQLTEELFQYSMVASETTEIVLEEVNLNRILEESISAYYGSLKSAGITPKITIPEQKVQRNLNARTVSRIFENIISNAIKYSDGDLNIVLTMDGEITFINSASKLDQIQVGKLFHRYYTVEDANKSTGLGLSIAKVLTEQLKGSISAQYDKGQLKICILFPDVILHSPRKLNIDG